MIVRILGRNGKAVHDGVGGKHAVGAVVDLPDDAAALLISAGAAAPAGDTDRAEAKRLANERADELRQAEQKARAERAMLAMHDDLPPEVRQAVYEHGDAVAQDYLQTLHDQDDSEPETQTKLNRKQRRAISRQRGEGSDA